MLLVLFAGTILILRRASVLAAPLDREFQECMDCPAMIAIPGGKFGMGRPTTEHGRFDSEGLQHIVSIRSFAIGKFDVTTDQFHEGDWISAEAMRCRPAEVSPTRGYNKRACVSPQPIKSTDGPIAWPLESETFSVSPVRPAGKRREGSAPIQRPNGQFRTGDR
jgi:formylglycine-generating enzyme required for sulfatase activity